jgi:hypothetical protein
MSIVRAESSALIRASARVVYRMIADYRESHPRFLPKKYFPLLEVERGGVGDGTVIRFQVRTAGRIREMRAEISEPAPGHVLVETDVKTGTRTTFTVTAEGAGEACRVDISTEWEAKGLRGWIERMTAPPILRRIYVEELANLAALAERQAGA